MNHRPLCCWIGLVLLPALISSFATAQPAATTTPEQPVNAAAEATSEVAVQADELLPVDMSIAEVQGLVQMRVAEDQPWQPAMAGVNVPIGAEFRTGPRSAVAVRIPPDQIVILDRLGTFKILDAVANHNNARTDIGMTYGRTQYQVEQAGIEHQSTIRSPSTTLAIRGTRRVTLHNQGRSFPAMVSSSDTQTEVFFQYRDIIIAGRSTGAVGESAASVADQARRDATQLTRDFASFTTYEYLIALQNPSFANGDQSALGNRQFIIANYFNSALGSSGSLPPPEDTFADITTTLASMNVRVYDNAAEDGDTVKVIFNGTVLNPALSLLNAGTVFTLNLNLGNNIFTLEDVFTPEGGGRVLTGAVQIPDGDTDFNFGMNEIGEQKSAIIRRVASTQPAN